MLNKESAHEIIKKLTSYTENYAVVSISDNGERLTRFANSEIHQNVEIDDAVINLTVYKGKKEASCSANAFDDESLKKLAADADEILALVPDGEFDIIPLVAEEVAETPNDTRLASAFDVEHRAAIIKKCIDTLDKDFTAAGVLSLDRDLRAFGNSDGAFFFYDFNRVSFDAVVTHKDGATGYGGLASNNLDDCDVAGAFQTAYDKAKLAINPQFAEIGAYTVILEPKAVGDLIGYVLNGLNAAAVIRGSSYAAGKVGQKVFGDNITICDDINNPATFQRFFDAEGYKRKPLTLIEKGVITNILHDSKTAKKSGASVTGHAMSNRGMGGSARNVVMTGGSSSLEEMIKNTKRGILVTHFHYTNSVNPRAAQVTGLTRDGTFLIEDGKISHPIMNMRFTESMIDAFNNVTELSSDLSKVPGRGGVSLLPSVKIENFHFTSGQK